MIFSPKDLPVILKLACGGTVFGMAEISTASTDPCLLHPCSSRGCSCMREEVACDNNLDRCQVDALISTEDGVSVARSVLTSIPGGGTAEVP